MSGVGVKAKASKGGGAPPLASAPEGPRRTPPNGGDPRNAPGIERDLDLSQLSHGSKIFVRKLSDISEINPRLTASLGKNDLVSFLPMAEVTAETGTTSQGTDRTYTEVSKGYTPFKHGDILVAKITPCFENGKIAQADIAQSFGFGSTEFHVIRANTDIIDTRYLLHFLRLPKVRLDGERRMTGSAGQKRVPESFLNDLDIFLPPLPEQRRIAEVLDRVEGLRAKRRNSLVLLENISQGIFETLFGDPFTNSGNWTKRRLDECSNQINDCPHSTPVWTEQGVICLRTSNLSEGDWNWSDKRFVSESTFIERSKRGRLEPGDIVLSREGTVGIAAIVGSDMRMCMGQRLVQVRADTSLLLPEFLLKYLLSVTSPVRISQFMVGSTSQHLNVKDLRALSIPVPPLNLQQEFARCIAAAEKLKASHRASLAQLDALFASLQHRAFRGEL